MEGKPKPASLLRLYAMYARMDAAWLMRDARLALLGITADLVSNIASVSGVFLLAWRFDGVGGLSRYEVLFMLGYVTVVNGIYQIMFSGGNTGHISRRIGRGQLDHMRIQPLPMPAQLLTEGFIPFSGGGNLLCGVGILTWALYGMGYRPDILWILVLFGYLLLSLSIIVGLLYLFSTLAFYYPVACEEISSCVYEFTGMLSIYPLSGMPVSVQLLLVTMIPVGLLGWFPACALLRKPPLGLSSLLPLFAALVLWFFTSIVFRKGMKYYVQTGSQRYKPYGHRS